MADCYYHGQSAPGPCSVCQSARRRKIDPKDVSEQAEPDLTQEDRERMRDREYSKKRGG